MNHWTIEAFLGEDAYNIDTDFLTRFVIPTICPMFVCLNLKKMPIQLCLREL